MKHISLKIPDELHAMLVQVSERRAAAKSDVIRAALESYFAGKNGAGLSCADLAGELVGSLSGPADLATNPKHMKGYGR